MLPLIVAGVVACSGTGDRDAGKGVRLGANGPDPLVIRVPLSGGIVRVYRYPRLDSLVWRSNESAPGLGALLAFDAESGVLAYVDDEGTPGWIDFRLGTVSRANETDLSLVASAEGTSIFGVKKGKVVVRLTPTGDWTHEASQKVRRLFPQPDGTLVVLEELNKKQARLVRYRPPEPNADDSLTFDLPQRGANTTLGDRVYFAVGDQLLGIPNGDMSNPVKVSVSDNILAIAPTPSGDRIYVASQGEKAVEIVDRYTASVSGRVRLPGFVTELRMDPLGRYVLARPVEGDSAWVIAIATDKLITTVPSAWRADLPMVAPDGSIGLLQGNDVSFLDATTGQSVGRVAGSGSDYWYWVLWNGLRPRAKGLDRAVLFQEEESTAAVAPADSTRPPDSSAVRATVPHADELAQPKPAVVAEPPQPAVKPASWLVSFAALLSEERARDLAREIRVTGASPRVQVTRNDGTTVYRVILGPYPTRADADRVGRSSGHSYWIIEGVP